jgi:formylmethanofuran dehydrogenase subunit B
MFEARVNGRAATLPAAIAAAARCLTQARFPVISGLAADVAGIRAAVKLARQLGCAFDHMASGALLSDLSVMQRVGWMCASPEEVVRTSDLLLCVGARAGSLAKAVFADRPPPPVVTVDGREIAGKLAILRALIGGQAPAELRKRNSAAARTARKLESATFGVAVWRQGDLEAPAVEMLMGLVRDLNRASRFTSLQLAAPANAMAAGLVSGWLSGHSVRTSFALQEPEHDPWAFDANRLVREGEADAVLWLSAFEPVLPAWSQKVPLVTLLARGAKRNSESSVLIEVGTPGVDHDAVLYNDAAGALVTVPAERPSPAPRAADVLSAVSEQAVAGATPR